MKPILRLIIKIIITLLCIIIIWLGLIDPGLETFNYIALSIYAVGLDLTGQSLILRIME